jgi:hypothetical protein
MKTLVRQMHLPTIPQLAGVVRPGLAHLVWRGLFMGSIRQPMGKVGLRQYLPAGYRLVLTETVALTKRWRGMEPGTRLEVWAFGLRWNVKWLMVRGEHGWWIITRHSPAHLRFRDSCMAIYL